MGKIQATLPTLPEVIHVRIEDGEDEPFLLAAASDKIDMKNFKKFPWWLVGEYKLVRMFETWV